MVQNWVYPLLHGISGLAIVEKSDGIIAHISNTPALVQINLGPAPNL